MEQAMEVKIIRRATMVAITLARLGLHETSLGVMEQIRMILELDILRHSTPITWVINIFLVKF